MSSILWSAPVPPTESTLTTWCCHPRASRLGWCSSACKPPHFSSKHNDGHYGLTVLFLFHQTRGHFSKKYDLCPFTVDIDTFVPVSSSIFTRSFAVVLGLIGTFRTKVHSSLGDRTCHTCVTHTHTHTYTHPLLFKSLGSLRNVLVFERKANLLSIKITYNLSGIQCRHC
jgi:hypothetical protein